MEKEQKFLSIVKQHRAMVLKVCYMYANDDNHLKDLYQEVLANLWQGLDSYGGSAKLSSWIYRVAINTCVSYFRRYDRNSSLLSPIEDVPEMGAEDSSKTDDLRTMYRMIYSLGKLDKAIILLWLDEYSYDEIAEMTGLSRNNVAVRLRRIKLKLIDKANQTEP
ncbi:MAG: sigma-70 family RNA polymerase sigma factor [Duncaniella sp.]|nr:sigma-70 family RNA polymerase sigma factor [Duncaniella sp.]